MSQTDPDAQGSLYNRLVLYMADALTNDSAPGLVLTVAIEPGTVQAGQALRSWQVEPSILARWLEAAIDSALTDLAIRHGARPAALRWSVNVGNFPGQAA